MICAVLLVDRLVWLANGGIRVDRVVTVFHMLSGRSSLSGGDVRFGDVGGPARNCGTRLVVRFMRSR